MIRRTALAPAAALLLAAGPAAAQWSPPLSPGNGQPGYPPPAYAPPAWGQAAPPPPASFGLPPGMPQVIQPSAPMAGAREVEQRLDQAKREDAGRRLEWVWIDAHGGLEQVGLTTFHGNGALTGGVVPTSSSGGVVGAGLGARLLFLTLLVRGRLGVGAIGHLYRVGPEIGLHVPLGRVEPHLELGGGYAAFGHGAGGASLGLTGGYGRAGLGLDYFVASVLSLGVGLSAEILGTRTSSASGLGGTLAATALVGLHL